MSEQRVAGKGRGGASAESDGYICCECPDQFSFFVKRMHLPLIRTERVPHKSNVSMRMVKSACGSSKGLRRVDPATLSYSAKSDGDDDNCWEEEANALEGMARKKDNGMWDSEMLKATTQNGAEMDEQMQRLVGICATVHRQVRATVTKLGRMVESVNAKGNDSPRNACELLRTYERIIWPSIVEVDLNIKSLSNSVRETIDSCNINEPRLEWLLNISKFRVTMENAIGNAIGVCAEIERILQIRVRGEVRGVRITEQKVAAIKAMQNEISNKMN